ncbi:MAG: OmpA family protein [Deltaproteobacteria bacterium]|nr:OmpA family protein [Deltaproteobacteria bacterium]MDZ4224392.1 OmpA family protein [bacterium]
MAVAAVAFLASCSKKYIRYEKRGGESSPPSKKGPQDPCPGQSCAGAEETKTKGIGGSAWVEGKPMVAVDSVKIGETTVDPSQSVYSVKELVSGTNFGFKVTTHIPQRAFLFSSGRSTPANHGEFHRSVGELSEFLLQAQSKSYACYLPTTDASAIIYISGHTDRTGSDVLNQKLSTERAKTVANSVTSYLDFKHSQLTAPITIKSIGMGEKVAAEAGRKDGVANDADRRVDVVTSSTGVPFGNEEDWETVGTITPE